MFFGLFKGAKVQKSFGATKEMQANLSAEVTEDLHVKVTATIEVDLIGEAKKTRSRNRNAARRHCDRLARINRTRETRAGRCMIAKLIAAVLAELGARLFAWTVAQRAKQQNDAASDAVIDKKVEVVKTAMSEALDGKPVTPEQKSKLHSAFRDLVRGGSSHGL